MTVYSMAKVKLCFVIMTLSLTIFSCSKDDGNNPTQPGNSNLSGIWSGTITSNLVTTPAAIMLSITHTGNNISGTYNVTTGAFGTIVGTVNNNSFNFNLTQTTPNCTGSFAGQGNINGTTISFTYNGNDCWGSHTNGVGNLTRYDASLDVICPLYVGAAWKYIDSTFTSSGVFSSRDSSMLAIIGKNTISYQSQNLEMFFWNWINLRTYKPQNYSWLVRNENDGLVFYGGYFRTQSTILGRALNIKYPVSINDSWNSPRHVFYPSDSTFKVADTTKMICISTNQIFITPAGSMNCYVYTYQRKYTKSGQAMTDDNCVYYVRNKGYVGMVVKTNGIMVFKKVLKR